MNTKNNKNKIDFFVRRTRNGWAILELDGSILFDGLESEAAAADFIVRFCQDHGILHAIHYEPRLDFVQLRSLTSLLP